MPGPEVHDKSTEIDGLTIQQLLLEDVGMCQTIHGRQNMGGPTIIGPRAQPHVSLQNLFHCRAVASGQSIIKTHYCSEPVEL